MKSTTIALISAAVIVGGAIVYSNMSSAPAADTTVVVNGNNVTVVDGKQIIDIQAKGGYSPQKNVAKAGIPTVLRIHTQGTFDCSSAFRIPSMNISKNLPPSGVTEIDLGSPSIAMLQGVCSMGMYSFEVEFQG